MSPSHDETSPRVVYLVGTAFCGSTLLSLLADAHRQLASVGELDGPIAPWDTLEFPCSCGRAIGACPFWLAVRQQMQARGQPLDLAHFHIRFRLARGRWANHLLGRSLGGNARDDLRDRWVRRLAPRRAAAIEAWQQRYRAMVESVLAVTGKKALLDATKDPVQGWRAWQVDGLEVRILHLVRDPRGFVASCVKKGLGLTGNLRWWVKNAAAAERLRERVGDGRFLRLRYEDLCRNPVDALNALAGFAGVEPVGELPGWRHRQHHVIGNQMRLGDNDAIRPDESWREDLPPLVLSAITKTTRRWRKKLGYGD
mgnify:CR=1 FL=1